MYVKLLLIAANQINARCLWRPVRLFTFRSVFRVDNKYFVSLNCVRVDNFKYFRFHTRSTMSDQNHYDQSDGDHSNQPADNPSQYLKTEKIAEGKWLSLNKVHYQDPKGNERVWEAVNRTTKHEGSADCVVVIATLKRLLHYDCLVLVKQFRPPVHSYTIEFPAGLIDDEETPEIAAVRELKEETGYVSSVKHLSPATCLDPGTEDCTAILVTVEIDGDTSCNKRPEPNPEGTEFIDVLLIPTNELLEKLNDLSAQGALVDARVYTYAVALVQATKQRRLEPAMK